MPLPKISQLKLLQSGRTEYPAGTNLFRPWLEPRPLLNFELWFVWRGKGVIYRDGVPTEIRQGQMFFFDVGPEYQPQQDPEHPFGLNFLIFKMHDVHGQPLNQKPKHLPDLISGMDPALAEAVTRRIIELHWESFIEQQLNNHDPSGTSDATTVLFTDEDEHTRSNPFVPLPIILTPAQTTPERPSLVSADTLFHGLMTEVIHQSERAQGESATGLEKMQRRMIAAVAIRIQESPGSIENLGELAASNGYSPDHFARTFKKIMGCSPQQFLVRSRINRAKRLLIESDLSVKQLADSLGYCNAYFFSRQFKTNTGQTPTEFRQERINQSL